MSSPTQDVARIGSVELVVLTVLLCLSAVPVALVLRYVDALSQDHLLLFGVALVILGVITYAAYPLIFKRLAAPQRRDPYLYLFAVFAFTTIIDFQLAMTIDGYTTILSFYLAEGERYLQSAYGSLINWWDGTTHFILYVIMIHALSLRTIQDCRNSSLYWVGSIVNSLLVFLTGNVTGPYGRQLRASYILNVPFLVVPLYYLKRVLDQPRPNPSRRVESSAVVGFVSAVFRVACLLFFAVAIVVSVLRVLCILDAPEPFIKEWDAFEPFLFDNSTYPRWQVMLYFYYFVPFCVYAFYSICVSFRSSWTGYSARFVDISVLFAGVMGQAQISFFPIAFHHLTPAKYKIDLSAVASQISVQLIVALNVALFVVPHLFALYVVASYQRSGSKTKTK